MNELPNLYPWLTPAEREEAERPCISYFKPPITRTRPHATVSLAQLWRGITGETWKGVTQQYREALARTRPDDRTGTSYTRRLKGQLFGSCTFSGEFSVRKDEALQQHSGLLTLDIDHIGRWQARETMFASLHPELDLQQAEGVCGLRHALLHDEKLEVRLLFRSPSGDGLKVVVAIDTQWAGHREWFRSMSNYLWQMYQVEVDASGSNPSRCCYLPHDAEAVLYRPDNEWKRNQKNVSQVNTIHHEQDR